MNIEIKMTHTYRERQKERSDFLKSKHLIMI